MAVSQHLWCDSEPEVDTVGIYVENHHGRCREFFIWIRFDNMKLSEKGHLALLLEDLLISEISPLEESASHHFPCKSQDSDKIVADVHHLWCDSEPEVDTGGIYVENH